MKRVVADTNVLVSALQFGGKPKQLLDLAVDGQVDLAVSTLGSFRGTPIQRVAEFLRDFPDQGRS